MPLDPSTDLRRNRSFSLVWLDHVKKPNRFMYCIWSIRYPSDNSDVSKSRRAKKFTLKDQSSFEYLQTNRVRVGGKE